MVTIAPEEQRCKLNLFVKPLEDEDPADGLDENIVKIPKTESLTLYEAPYGSLVNLTEEEKHTL